MEVVNRPDRVYQAWVNGNESCYYRGNIDALNAAVLTFSKAKLRVHQVVLLPAPGQATTFSGKKAPCDWRLNMLGRMAAQSVKQKRQEQDEMGVLVLNPTIYVLVDERTRLEQLRIPSHVKLLGDQELLDHYRAAAEKAAE